MAMDFLSQDEVDALLYGTKSEAQTNATVRSPEELVELLKSVQTRYAEQRNLYSGRIEGLQMSIDALETMIQRNKVAGKPGPVYAYKTEKATK